MKPFSVIIAALFCGLVSCIAQTKGYKSVEVEEFSQVIADANVVRLDVRSAEEYATGHIADAINIDVRKPDFESLSVATLPKGKLLAIYCRSGRRSKMAADILVKKGYQIVELNSGIIGWTKAGKPTTTEAVDLFSTKGGTSIYIYSIKHGSIRMKIGDKWLYVDPVSTGVAPATDFTTMPKADYILVTHEHFDHLDSLAIRQLTKDGTLLIANPKSNEILGGMGESMKNGGKKNLSKIVKVNAVPAYNTTKEKLQFHPKGRDNGYVLTIEGFRIYIAGDTEETPEMKKLEEVDVAFLPCNLPYTMSVEQVVSAAKTIQPKVLFPYHYGDTDVNQVVKLLESSGIDVRIRPFK